MSLSPRLGPAKNIPMRLTPSQLEARARVLLRLEDGTYPTESVACFCGENDGFVIAERDRYGLPVRTLLCGRCGLMRTSPRMTAEATRRFYEEDYRQLYSAAAAPPKLFEQQAARGASLVALLGKLLPRIGSVYEVGCGAGGLLAAFAERGKHVAGCDLGGEYLAEGRGRGLDLIQGDAAALLEHRGEAADLVLLIHSLEHFLDLRRELGQILELVREDGLLLVEVPGIQSIQTVYHEDLLLYLQNAHTFHFTDQTLAYVLRSMGLEVLFSDPRALALARRPPAGGRVEAPAPPEGESSRILRFLADLEIKKLRAREAAPQMASAQGCSARSTGA